MSENPASAEAIPELGTSVDHTWDLFVELRKEVLETQKLRSQTLGIKVTFASAFIAVYIATTKAESGFQVDPLVFVIPAFASLFFDLLIESYSFSIHRIGRYTRDVLEPTLQGRGSLPNFDSHEFIAWQRFLSNDDKTRWKKYFVALAYAGFDGILIFVAFFSLQKKGNDLEWWGAGVLGLFAILMFIQRIMQHQGRS